MKLLHLLLIFALLGTVACSNNKTKSEDSEAVSAAGMDEEDSDFVVDSEEDEDLLVDDTVESEPNEDEIAEADDEELIDDELDIVATGGDEEGSYTVQKGDTLMWIAFKIYGDYAKWQQVEEENPGLSANSLKPGDTVNYTGSMFSDTYRPKGKSHLVLGGETLGTISNDRYGTVKRWKSIYTNNQPLIKDPNLIFAGFTLYYVPGRDVASE
jgi:nucleoid-associated protein YgaU